MRMLMNAAATVLLMLSAVSTASAEESSAFNLVLMPDTQSYAEYHPKIFRSQTQWIADNASTISFVLQLGDITNRNVEKQWKVAASAMGIMDGKVPYAFVAGNHDIGTSGTSNVRETKFFNQYFPYSKYSKLPDFGGAYEKGKIDNTWHTFKAGGIDWLVVCLEFGPRNSVIDWAKNVIADHPEYKVIINTHAYMYSDDTRMGEGDKWLPQNYGLGKATGEDAVNDGEMIWEKLASQYPNVMFVFSGHVLNDGTGKLVSNGKAGNKVYQMLANYQSGVKGSKNGGDGFLRILHIDPAAGTISVTSWSPYLKTFNTEPDQQFEFKDVQF